MTTTLTPEQMRALAERIAADAAELERNAGSYGRIQDFRAAADFMRQCAEAGPVAWVNVADSYEGPYTYNGLELLAVGRHPLYL
ncbi:MAG: hypothetical protein NUV51_06585, partial [Sulfuricaulis sp.]|nr:hypothetical protein [Sulfuricaulis sp.]